MDELISLLTPTRGRPTEFQRMVISAYDTAVEPEKVEVVIYVDDDDKFLSDYKEATSRLSNVILLVGPRTIMTDYWNICFRSAKGDILCQNNDDVIFRTKGWDKMVRDAFASQPDKILMVHGSDASFHLDRFGPHPFVHRKWIETVGYFIPPYFSSDFGDAWINEVASHLKRRKYIPFIMEHMHYQFNKAQIDQTTRDRLERHDKDRPEQIWGQKGNERMENVRKLGAVMVPPHEPRRLPPPSNQGFKPKHLG